MRELLKISQEEKVPFQFASYQIEHATGVRLIFRYIILFRFVHRSIAGYIWVEILILDTFGNAG